MAKKIKKSNTIKGLLLALVIAVGLYLASILVIKQFAPAEGAHQFYISLYDHANAVVKFITDYGFVIVLLIIVLLAFVAVIKHRK